MNDRYDACFVWPPLRPVAPEQAVRASGMRTEGAASWLRRVWAATAPVIPEPITTSSVFSGSSSEERCLAIGAGGSCQYDIKGFGFGIPGEIEARASIFNYCQTF